MRQLELFFLVHRESGGLLPVAQRGVEYVDVLHEGSFEQYQYFAARANESNL